MVSGQEPRPDFLQALNQKKNTLPPAVSSVSYFKMEPLQPHEFDIVAKRLEHKAHCECTDQISTSPTNKNPLS